MKKRSGTHGGARKRTRVRREQPSARVAAGPGNAVFLVGFMGAGKSSVGQVLGRRLNWVFEDLDDRIQQREGRSLAEIFRDSGEPAFRRAEQMALKQVLEELRGGVARIVALGGGAFVQTENAALLKKSGVPTVFLDAPVEELWQRCCEQATEAGAERPLLRSRQQFRELYQARSKNYLKADLKMETSSRTVEAIAAEIAQVLGLKTIATRIEQGDVE